MVKSTREMILSQRFECPNSLPIEKASVILTRKQMQNYLGSCRYWNRQSPMLVTYHHPIVIPTMQVHLFIFFSLFSLQTDINAVISLYKHMPQNVLFPRTGHWKMEL